MKCEQLIIEGPEAIGALLRRWFGVMPFDVPTGTARGDAGAPLVMRLVDGAGFTVADVATR